MQFALAGDGSGLSAASAQSSERPLAVAAINGQPEYLTPAELKPVTSIQMVIQNPNGTVTPYTLPLNTINAQYITSNITLPAGTYKVNQFLVMNGDTAVYGTPAAAGKFAKLVTKPLPTSFVLTAASTSVTIVAPEIIEIPSNAVPADFGATAFTLSPIATRTFKIAAQTLDANGQNPVATTARLVVTSSTGTVFDADIAASTNTLVILKQAAGYVFTISKSGYSTQTINISDTQIANYITTALGIQLTSATGYGLVAKAGGGYYDKTVCVLDNSTGLVWEAGSEASRSQRYTNYEGNINPTNSWGYATSVNRQSLCGFTNWRMPSRDEMLTLQKNINPASNPWINTAWFPNTCSYYYWTGSYVAGSDAYILNFGPGTAPQPWSYSPQGNTLCIRLVRN